jgi:competence protein ComEC
LRWLALVPAGVGIAFAASPDRYDIYVDREGAGAAIRNVRGELTLVGKPSGFVAEQWLRADGDARNADDATLKQSARCDRLGCVVETNAHRAVAFVQEFSAFEEDCRRAAIIISKLQAPSSCDAALVIDRTSLNERGAIAVRRGADATEIRSVKKGREAHIWPGAKTAGADAQKTTAQEHPRPARPVPEQDLPEEEISSDEPG